MIQLCHQIIHDDLGRTYDKWVWLENDYYEEN